jgi:hypothetical protein
MKRGIAIVFFAVITLVLGATFLYAADLSDVGSPAFKQISSNTMTLKYGSRGASVLDNSLKKWIFHQMATITGSKLEGHVNKINNNFALAAGLDEVAIYDYSKHAWFVYKKKGADDSIGALQWNFELTKNQAKVKTSKGPFIKYTTATGWIEAK